MAADPADRHGTLASMDISKDHQITWTATQVRALAVTGLASSHLQPFIRLLYNDPKLHSRRSNGSGKTRSILVESSGASDEVVCSRRRERHGKFTATWISSANSGDSGEIFNLHSAVDCVELQLWNRFANGSDVYLGKASISLHQLQQQCSEVLTRETAPQETLKTSALWFPLQTSEESGLCSQLSLQVECIFTSDPKVRRIHQEIRRRSKKKTKLKGEANSNDELSEGNQSDEHPDKTIVDPAFAFTQPFLPVEWSLVAATSIRQLFFHAEVEHLTDFRELVLYGDLEQELDRDEDLQIHDDHLTAFKTCQLSAQYLDHCVQSLSQRLQHYSDDFHVLADRRKQLARKNRSLKTQRRRLQKEHDDLDLLIATYQRVLEKNGGEKLPAEAPKSPTEGVPATPLLSPKSPLSSTASSPTKPVLLKTWEEREHERRLEKEISKAQRIEEEKQRLNQRMLERQQRDDYEARIVKIADIRKQHAARRIQLLTRKFLNTLHTQRDDEINRAATLIQAAWKRFVLVKQYPRRLETGKQQKELALMAQNERELRLWLARMEQESTTVSPEGPNSEDKADSPAVSPSKEVVDALVATWRKLHRVFVLAHTTKGIDYTELFSQIDLRKDDVIDRAEMRLGARSFGVRLNRQVTRALIALVRTKCGVSPKPLLITFEHFVQGFELKQTVAKAEDFHLGIEVKLEFSVDDGAAESSIRGKTQHPSNISRNQLKSPVSDEEVLVTAVRAFRAAVYEAAMTHLTKLGKSTADYRAFRDALVHLFRGFDVDNDGQLDINELVACMASFNLQLSNESVSLIRELFIGDHANNAIGVPEFISFVLAHASKASEHYNDDELGLLGHRLREAIMHRVQEAQTQSQSESAEDAVKIVFGAAFKRKGQQECPIRDFVRALVRLHLGMTSAQLALLAVRLDHDGNHSISLDELLVWLRIRTNGSLSSSLQKSLLSSEQSPTSHAALHIATKKAKELRLILGKLADKVGRTSAPPTDKKTSLVALFRQIDKNDSGQINEEELQTFLESQTLSDVVGEGILDQFGGNSSLPQHPGALIAKGMMELLDLNANGVVTLKEWLAFALHESSEENVDDPVVIEAMRKALIGSENEDPQRLAVWFSGLPGAMQIATTLSGEPVQVKIRVAEFKNALRMKLGGARSIPLRTIDRVVESLDRDSSGWITTNELQTWAFPPRDLEEILRLAIRSWQLERQRGLNPTDLAGSLYKQFDTDSNGSIGVREILSGFGSFGVHLTDYEARVLMVAFDLDGDGCWSKAEFIAFVSKLVPVDFAVEPLPVIAPTHESADVDTHEVNAFDGSEYSDDELALSGASHAASTPANISEDEVVVRPLDYSEDFGE
ncbi:hypothetical protein PHYBOEH_001718 [Phytophthora boehmeriae]|uniref:EF-hand domain-containing protein n=1 Tax=Phytophthora boehmeriae TaxID=109152 RepID=A0A8T1WZ43_9STRA|nr:hypothetical protein PHYBOEH_001718 [Phytophthora boehmeriae]